MAGIDRTTGKMLDGWAHVEQSLKVLITTSLGSRVERRNIGSRLPRLVDSPISAHTLVDFYAATAGVIDKWEPRFRLNRVNMSQPETGHLLVDAEGIYFPRGHLGDFSIQPAENRECFAMTLRFASTNLDLSRLPSPEVIKSVDYEQILAQRLADLVARFKAIGIDLDTTSLESEPAVILEQADAYREALALAAINDAARSVMLAFATGGDLEHLGAFFGVQRLTVTPATNDAPAIMEDDASLRARIQLAPEALPYAGMTGGGYRSLALKTAPSLKDVLPLKRSGGQVDIVLLGA
jgi:phage baseplate assembly protein W